MLVSGRLGERGLKNAKGKKCKEEQVPLLSPCPVGSESKLAAGSWRVQTLLLYPQGQVGAQGQAGLYHGVRAPPSGPRGMTSDTPLWS